MELRIDVGIPTSIRQFQHIRFLKQLLGAFRLQFPPTPGGARKDAGFQMLQLRFQRPLPHKDYEAHPEESEIDPRNRPMDNDQISTRRSVFAVRKEGAHSKWQVLREFARSDCGDARKHHQRFRRVARVAPFFKRLLGQYGRLLFVFSQCRNTGIVNRWRETVFAQLFADVIGREIFKRRIVTWSDDIENR